MDLRPVPFLFRVAFVCVCLCKQARAPLQDPFYDEQFDDAEYGPPSPGRRQVSLFTADVVPLFFSVLQK